MFSGPRNRAERFVVRVPGPGTGTPIFAKNWFNDRAWSECPNEYPRSRRSEPQCGHALRLFFVK